MNNPSPIKTAPERIYAREAGFHYDADARQYHPAGLWQENKFHPDAIAYVRSDIIETPLNDKTHPRFMEGYKAGLNDGRIESFAPKPFAYLYEHRDCDEETQFWTERQFDLVRNRHFTEIPLYKKSSKQS